MIKEKFSKFIGAINWARSLASPVDEISKDFLRKKKIDKRSSSVVAIQAVEDPYYYSLFGCLVQEMQKNHDVVSEYVLFRSLNVDENGLFKFLKARFLGSIISYEWEKAYQSFCANKAYSSISFLPLGDFIDLVHAFRLFSQLESKEDVLSLSYNGIDIGDLVCDSYLRFKPSPVLEIKDKYLLLIIWQALRDIRRSSKYFSRVKPSLYLSSYSAYIHHGIAVRVALVYGISVYTFGNFQEVAKPLSIEDFHHIKNSTRYPEKFSELPDQDACITQAELQLGGRISGHKDMATAYMKTSAYEKTVESVPDVKGKAVIFMHDFYDSPHIYPRVLFPDFWQWICFTIDFLLKEDIPFVVKSHPNQIALGEKDLDMLKKLYPSVCFIDPKITNLQLVDAGMTCAITVYGTVAAEMAYLGVPTIGCSESTYHRFDFCRNAFSYDEYCELLLNSKNMPFNKAEMRLQSLVFYYMHNIHSKYDDAELRQACSDAMYGNPKDILGTFKSIRALNSFVELAQRLYVAEVVE